MMALRTVYIRWAMGLVGALLLGHAALANPSLLGPRDTVEQTTQAVVDTLDANIDQLQSDPSAVEALIAEIVLPRFDFELMSRFVLGRHWRSADDAQQRAFIEAFQKLLIRTYAKALSEYDGQAVEIPAQRIADDSERVTVKSSIQRSNGPAVSVDYALWKRADGWKVFDVTVEGVSLVQNYRAQFDDVVRSDGIDQLIERIRQKEAIPLNE